MADLLEDLVVIGCLVEWPVALFFRNTKKQQVLEASYPASYASCSRHDKVLL